MAKKQFLVKGISVELWATSFKIGDMKNVFWPTHITEEDVTQFINEVYRAIEKRAVESGNRIIANKILNLLEENRND